jgi:hypothetical protein
MKTIRTMALILLSTVALTGICQQLKQPQEPEINFKVPKSQVGSLLYAIRYTQVLDAKTANELADLLVKQANDTTLNKPTVQQKPTDSHK